jgi:hypothetical protein
MGERARTIGTEAENKAWNFIESLGYKIEDKNNEQYDIDGLAVFLPKLEREGLIRPRYAPNGYTAFEVTEESFRKTKVTAFRDKIIRYNNDHTEEKIEGGVLLIDQKASPGMITFMKQNGIWGWGSSRQTLYKTKLRVMNEWLEKNHFTSELSMNDDVSFLRCSTPPPTTSDRLLNFAVFVDNDFVKLSMRKTIQILNGIKENSIRPLLEAGIAPVNVHLEFHSVGGVSISEKDLEENLASLWRTEGINIMGRCTFSDYRSFPFL